MFLIDRQQVHGERSVRRSPTLIAEVSRAHSGILRFAPRWSITAVLNAMTAQGWSPATIEQTATAFRLSHLRFHVAPKACKMR